MNRRRTRFIRANFHLNEFHPFSRSFTQQQFLPQQSTAIDIHTVVILTAAGSFKARGTFFSTDTYIQSTDAVPMEIAN
jgi:hypothetical protein